MALGILVLTAVLALAGCGNTGRSVGSGNKTGEAGLGASDEVTVSVLPDGGEGLPRVVDATLGSDGEFLGMVVAARVDSDSTDFWLRSPLVDERVWGHVHYAVTGRSVRVELIPAGDAEGGGSQISLAAIRLLDAPSDRLLELAVYRN